MIDKGKTSAGRITVVIHGRHADRPDSRDGVRTADGDEITVTAGQVTVRRGGQRVETLPPDRVASIGPWRQTTPYAKALARRTNRNAYAPWTAQEDGQLLDCYRAGDGVAELSVVLGRSASSIRTRLGGLLLPGDEPDESGGRLRSRRRLRP